MSRPGAPPAYTARDYESSEWPTLRQTLDALMTHEPGAFQSISYEQMYSAVYKCVCRGFGERLYGDLMAHLRAHLSQWEHNLSAHAGVELVLAFHRHHEQYLFALTCIVPIFTYLDRFYVLTKLNLPLEYLLTQLFVECVADSIAPRIVVLLGELESTPFAIQPDVRLKLMQNLAELDGGKYADMRPQLFAKYVTGVRPQMEEADVAKQMQEEARVMKQLAQSGFAQGTGAKRGREEEEHGDETRCRQVQRPANWQPQTHKFF